MPANVPAAQVHLAVNIDVLRLVIEQLRRDSQHRSLFRLARTCKTVCGYALDALWYSMSTLVPLLNSFPSDVWKRVEGNWVRWAIILKCLHLYCFKSLARPPSREQDWARFYRYAAKVKEIYVFENGLPGLDILPYLRIHLPRDFVLFPNLHILYWRGTSSPELLHYSSLLLSPSLADCSLESDVHGVVSTMHAMNGLYPDIKRLFISTSATDVVPMIKPYSNLTSFKFFSTSRISITDLALSCLAPLPYLTEWITNASLDRLTSTSIVSQNRGGLFPALQVLSLRGTHTGSVAELLPAITSRSLHKFTYTYSHVAASSQILVEPLADALAGHTNLDDLLLCATSGLHASFAALAPLARLPMRKLRLENIVASAELSDAHVAALTRPWRSLTHFCCCNDDTPVRRGALSVLPTPALFAHFAAHCPRLVHLWLTVDVTAVPPPSAVPLPRSAAPLYFHPHASLLSRRTELVRMLEYITEIYPRLSLRLSDDIGYSDPDTVEIIDELDALIPAIVREGEDRRRKASVA